MEPNAQTAKDNKVAISETGRVSEKKKKNENKSANEINGIEKQ